MAVIASSFTLRAHIREQVQSHMLRRLRKTETCEIPYAHFWVQEVFPPDIYAQMLENLPAIRIIFRSEVERFYRQDGTSTRLQLPVLEHRLANLPGDQAEFWLGIHDVLHSRS